MTRLGVLLAAVLVLFVAWLLVAAPAYPAPPADAVIDPCPMMWSQERGLYGGCLVYLPALEVRR